MATNLVDITKSVFTPELIQRVSALIGESPTTTQKALDSAVPSVFAGVLQYTSSSPDGVGRLGRLLDRENYEQLLGNLSHLLSGGDGSQTLMSSGKDLLNTIFGNRVNAVTDLIATNSGMNRTSVSSLLSITVPLLLGVLGRERRIQGLSPAGLVGVLLENREEMARLAPPGLAGILGVANLRNLGSSLTDTTPAVAGSAKSATHVATTPYDEESAIGKWLVPLLIAGLLIPWFIFSRGCGGASPPPPPAQHGLAPTQQPTPAVKDYLVSNGIDEDRLFDLRIRPGKAGGVS